MAIDNNERDECGTGRNNCGTGNDAPPSYQNLLQQEAFSNGQNFFPTINMTATQNRTNKKCILCQCCHQERIQHSRQSVKSLNRLNDILENHMRTTESQTISTMMFIVIFAMIYIFYSWTSTIISPAYIIDKKYQQALANFNITEDIQEILLDLSKRRMISDFRTCILANL